MLEVSCSRRVGRRRGNRRRLVVALPVATEPLVRHHPALALARSVAVVGGGGQRLADLRTVRVLDSDRPGFPLRGERDVAVNICDSLVGYAVAGGVNPAVERPSALRGDRQRKGHALAWRGV